jgi:translation initiation factor 2 alpha subunit (eIF-2alpha)
MFKENDFLLCSVKSIEGTTVFVTIDENTQGSIVFSEIAAGRIRNIREYVHPGKKIVCKILKILPDHLELSFRRVTASERDEILERHKKTKTFENMLKAITKNPQQIIDKIKEKYELWDFYDQARESPQILENFLKKSEADVIIKLLQDKKEKEKVVKKIIIIKSFSETGLFDIKEILKIKNADIRYLGSSKFSVEATAKDFKEAEHSVDKVIQQIETKAREKKAIFEAKEKLK